jgi:hypothetical protein
MFVLMRNKIIATTVLFAVPAFLLGKMIWPPDPMGPVPTSVQLPLFIFLAFMEALTFGLGASFVLFGWPLLKKISDSSRNLAKLTFASIAWLLISWWPHDNMHIHNGMDLSGLLVIEYLFHFSLMVAGIILAYSFLRLTLKSSAGK